MLLVLFILFPIKIICFSLVATSIPFFIKLVPSDNCSSWISLKITARFLDQSEYGGKYLKIISSLPNFINVPLYLVLSLRIRVSPKQTDISSNDINFFTKLISSTKSNNHQRNRKQTFFSNTLWGILCLDFIVGGLYVEKRSCCLN